MPHQAEKSGAALFLCGGLIFAAVYQTIKVHHDGGKVSVFPLYRKPSFFQLKPFLPNQIHRYFAVESPFLAASVSSVLFDFGEKVVYPPYTLAFELIRVPALPECMVKRPVCSDFLQPRQ